MERGVAERNGGYT